MSTIKVDTVQNTSGVQQFLAKAWVNFNGNGTVAIRSSGNVSSITDNDAGDYTVNFTAVSDVNFGVCYSLENRDPAYGHFITTAARTSSAVQINTAQSNLLSGVDYSNVNVTVFR